jgi:hypothetical protein
MDWSNERYVRLYTRDTTSWKLFSWEARFVLMSLLRKVDRSGVLDVGNDGIEGLAALIEVPLEIAAVGVPQLLKRETLVQRDTLFVMPNFLPAQEAKQSDAMRKREERERRRHAALAGTRHADDEFPDKPSRNVTEPENESRNVTDSYESRTERPLNPIYVTPSQAEPSQAEPSQSLARDPWTPESVPQSALPPPEPIASAPRGTLQIAPPAAEWTGLALETWNAARERYGQLIASGVDSTARPGAWNGLPLPIVGDRIREMRERGLTYTEAREKALGAIETAAARATNSQRLEYFTPNRFFARESFGISAETSPAQVTRPRAGPRVADEAPRRHIPKL